MTGTIRDLLQYSWHRKEAFIWLAALLFLAFSNPHQHHYTLCPFDNLGFANCPGCGIGRSITSFLHLDFKSSFLYHPLGIPAVFLIVARIIRIFRRNYRIDLTFNQPKPL